MQNTIKGGAAGSRLTFQRAFSSPTLHVDNTLKFKPNMERNGSDLENKILSLSARSLQK